MNILKEISQYKAWKDGVVHTTPKSFASKKVFSRFKRCYFYTTLLGISIESKKAMMIMVLAVLCIFFTLFGCTAFASPLNEIELYEISVCPENNGMLMITYDIRWTVLDRDRDGPLEWVKLEMINPSFEIKKFGGDAKGVSKLDKSSIRVDLKRTFIKGETAHFNVTVKQNYILTYKEEKDISGDSFFLYHYRFTPGWFPDIEVKKYMFFWIMEDRIPQAHNADYSENGYLLWTGSFAPNGKRDLQVTYPKEAFNWDEVIALRYDPNSYVNKEKTSGNNDTGGEGLLLAVLLMPIMWTVRSYFIGSRKYRRNRRWIWRWMSLCWMCLYLHLRRWYRGRTSH